MTAFRVAPLVQERVQLLGEVPGMVGFLFTDEVTYAEDALKGLPANAAEVLDACVVALEPLEEFTPEKIQEALAAELVEKLELAAHRLRPAARGHHGPPDLPAAVRVDGAAGQGGVASSSALPVGVPRRLRRDAPGRRITAHRFWCSAAARVGLILGARLRFRPWGMV